MTCPRHPVTCTHADFGCPWQGDREALETKHINECAYEGIKDYLHQQQQSEQLLRDQVKAMSKENEMLKRQHDDLRQQFHTLSDQLALMFPSHFVPDGPTAGESSPPPLTETQRLKNEIDTISTNLQNLELKQNMTLMTETFRLQEEMQSLRTICHGMRMQMHYLMMDRRDAAATATSGAHHHESRASSSNAAAAAASDNNATAVGPVLNKMRSWLGKKKKSMIKVLL